MKLYTQVHTSVLQRENENVILYSKLKIRKLFVLSSLFSAGHHLKQASCGVLWSYSVEFTRWNFQWHTYRIVQLQKSGCHLFAMHKLVKFQKSRYFYHIISKNPLKAIYLWEALVFNSQVQKHERCCMSPENV